MSNPEDRLPPTSDEYFEIETAKKHGGWPVWRALSVQDRAKLMAHEMHAGMREHYYFDKRLKGDKAEKPKLEAPWEKVKKRYGM